LVATLRGFSQIKNDDPFDQSGKALQDATFGRSIINAGLANARTTESLYAGVPKDPAVNLHNINLTNIRENSIYAF
jgi:hypothetical protein